MSLRKAYISISFHGRKLMDAELAAIIETLHQYGIYPLVFVDYYVFKSNDQNRMMLQAMQDIDKCDLLIAETSEKAIGVGVEVGYAKAKGKPVIYCRRSSAEHSTTVSGISDHQIIYSSVNELKSELANCLASISTAKASN